MTIGHAPCSFSGPANREAVTSLERFLAMYATLTHTTQGHQELSQLHLQNINSNTIGRREYALHAYQ